MTDFAKLILTADATGLKQGEAALDSIAAKGAQAETKVTKATAGMSKGMKDVGSSAGGMAPQIQNASYQVGDFAVQIASGTDATRALAQQMPQLLGSFGMFGALAGAAVAIGGALVPVLFEGASGAKEMADALEELGDRIKEYKDFAALANADTADLKERFGDLADSARQVYEGLAKIAEIEALNSISAATVEMERQFRQLRADLRDIEEAQAQGASTADLQRYLVEGLADSYGLTVEQARELVGLLDDMKAGGSLTEQAEATEAVALFLQDAVTSGSEFNSEQVEAAKAASELALHIMDVAGNSDAAAGAISGISANLAAARGEAEALSWALATLPGASLREMDDGRGSQREGARDLAEWRTDEWLRKRREAEVAANRKPRGGGRKSGGGRGRTSPDEKWGDDVADYQRQTEALLAQADALAKVTAAGGDWERALAVIEEEQKLLNEAQRAGVAITPEVEQGIKDMAEAYVAAEEQLESLREKQEEFAQAQEEIKDAFGSAFSDWISGAASFSDALSGIIAKLAEMAASKAFEALWMGAGGNSFAGLLAGALGFGGGVSGNDALSQALRATGASFDGGGYTGSGARTGGLDGKGGFIAMMHPNETVIDHTKGQGGGASVHVTVGIDESGNLQVRRIARQEAASMGQALNSSLPSSIQQYSRNPRRRS